LVLITKRDGTTSLLGVDAGGRPGRFPVGSAEGAGPVVGAASAGAAVSAIAMARTVGLMVFPFA
jgi:hypothetical protein